MRSIKTREMFTFIAISLFYLFETGQMSYYNVLAPTYLNHGVFNHANIGAISAAYYYGDVAGLFPVGYALDRLSLRPSLIFALTGSIAGAFILFMSNSFAIQWISRFICGFCGGTFSFIGGIRIVSTIFKDRFSFGFSIFLAAGILGAMLCQYPLLIIANHFGAKGALFIMFSVGILIGIFNFFYLHPTTQITPQDNTPKYAGSHWQMLKDIVFNLRNWLDVFMIVLIETPGTILGTLWGVVLMMNFFHYNAIVSSWITTIMLLGSIIGLPILGRIADKYNNNRWIMIYCTLICIALILSMFAYQHAGNLWVIGSLFFGLGFFCSCQTIGFHWITSNMKPALIGRNSAFNSMIFMSCNGALKQFSAYMLTYSPVLFIKSGSSGNLLTIIFSSLLLTFLYLLFRKNRVNSCSETKFCSVTCLIHPDMS